MPTNVRLRLRGLLVLAAKEGQPIGKVGILHAPPSPPDPFTQHKLAIVVSRLPHGPLPPIPILTRPHIGPNLSLEIENGAHPTIAIRNRNSVNRHQSAMEPESFKWFVDFENGELYTGPIGSNNGFESLLTFNGGELFTVDRPNDSILQIQRRRGTDYEPFGRVAFGLGIDFRSATRAIFKNEGTTVFDSAQEPNTNYRIDIIHDAPLHPSPVEDANHYYTVLGTMIPERDRILFRSENEEQLLRARLEEAMLSKDREQERAPEAEIGELERTLDRFIGPEAACFTAYLSRTDIALNGDSSKTSNNE